MLRLLFMRVMFKMGKCLLTYDIFLDGYEVERNDRKATAIAILVIYTSTLQVKIQI